MSNGDKIINVNVDVLEDLLVSATFYVSMATTAIEQGQFNPTFDEMLELHRRTNSAKVILNQLERFRNARQS